MAEVADSEVEEGLKKVAEANRPYGAKAAVTHGAEERGPPMRRGGASSARAAELRAVITAK